MIMKNNNVLYQRVRDAVHRQWDPIGVAAYSEELGEYDSYIPKLYELLESGASAEKIFDYLWILEVDSMGLTGDKQATEEFSSWLYSLFQSDKEIKGSG